jgi:hypothetical protein
MVIQALVLWGLWRGSAVAWVVAMAFAVLTFLSWVLMQPPPEIGVFLILVVSVVQAAILCTREVRTHVDRAGDAYTLNASRAVPRGASSSPPPPRRRFCAAQSPRPPSRG